MSSTGKVTATLRHQTVWRKILGERVVDVVPQEGGGSCKRGIPKEGTDGESAGGFRRTRKYKSCSRFLRGVESKGGGQRRKITLEDDRKRNGCGKRRGKWFLCLGKNWRGGGNEVLKDIPQGRRKTLFLKQGRVALCRKKMVLRAGSSQDGMGKSC